MTPPRSHLVACPGCARHVRASESACPFCKGAVAESVRAVEPRRAPAERLSRAGLVAFGLGTLTAATACGGEVVGQSSGGGVSVPFYGAATLIYPDAGGDEGGLDGDAASVDAEETFDATTLAPYGQVPFDAGEQGDATQIEPPPDARVAPPYGAPPPAGP